MPKPDPILQKVRAICLALPDTKETLTWGKPHFRVGEKIFCGFGDDTGEPSIGFKMQKEVAFAIVSDPRFFRAPYVGQHGWVGLRARTIRAKDWEQVRAMIVESYRLVAPKSSRARLDAATGARPARGKSPRAKSSPTRKAR